LVDGARQLERRGRDAALQLPQPSCGAACRSAVYSKGGTLSSTVSRRGLAAACLLIHTAVPSAAPGNPTAAVPPSAGLRYQTRDFHYHLPPCRLCSTRAAAASKRGAPPRLAEWPACLQLAQRLINFK
jgi:hypothetical protein